MKFEKALNEAIKRNLKKLEENLLTNVIDNWPFYVLKQWKIMNTTDEKMKQTLQKELDNDLISIETVNGQKWIGDLKTDLLSIINKRPYMSDSYTIKNGSILVTIGEKKEWISYLTSPAAMELLKKIQAKLAQQKGSIAQGSNVAGAQDKMNQDKNQAAAMQGQALRPPAPPKF